MFLLSLVLFALVLAAYRPVRSAQFTNYDDPQYVSENHHVQRGLNLANVGWAFTTFSQANWHPVTWLSHMLDVRLFGLNPAGHHMVSVWLHAINSVLLFLLLWRATGHVGRSFLVAALFGLHPLNVESVAWIAERKSLLSTLFGLLAMASYGWYARRASAWRYLTVVLLFALSLMSKPMLVTLPLLLLILDYWPFRRFGKTNWRLLLWEKVPLALMSAAACVVTIIAQKRGGAVRSVAALPFELRIQNALASYFKYLYKMIWPAKLAVFYPLLGIQRELWVLAVCAIGFVLLTHLFLRMRGKLPWVWAGWLWYVLTLVPVIGLVQVGDQAMADRYAYIPLLGIFVAIIWTAAEWCGEVPSRRAPAVAGCAAIIAILGMLTWRQASYWQNTFTLFDHALQVTSNNWIAHDNLGQAYLETGMPEQAMQHIQAAIAINPRDTISRYNLARKLLIAGDIDEAMKQYRILLAQPEVDIEVLSRMENNVAAAYLNRGDLEKARIYFSKSVSLDSESNTSYAGLCVVAYRQTRLGDAIAECRRSLAIIPNLVAYYFLGRALEDSGNSSAALQAYEAALQFTPNDQELRQRRDAVATKQAPNR